jgi:hypothetical protein
VHSAIVFLPGDGKAVTKVEHLEATRWHPADTHGPELGAGVNRRLRRRAHRRPLGYEWGSL